MKKLALAKDKALRAIGAKSSRKALPKGEQAAALGLREVADGKSEVLLVTSLDTGRWVLPKGWVERGETARDAARREAVEEAGLTGTLDREPLGCFSYLKQRPRRGDANCQVAVYVLRDVVENPVWPEKPQRRRAWFPIEEAASLVDEADLSALIASLAHREAAE
jgi:8-oxo-dGTP pyrophosphatase MutT (NUDIX family)